MTAAPKLHSLSPSHDIRDLLRQIITLAQQTRDRDETIHSFSQEVVHLLYATKSGLAREAYVSVLERLCELSERTAASVMEWLHVYNDMVRPLIWSCNLRH